MHIRNRDMLVRVLDEMEEVVRDMTLDLERLRHPEKWEDYFGECSQLEYVQRELEMNDTGWILARLGDVRGAVLRLVSPTDEPPARKSDPPASAS